MLMFPSQVVRRTYAVATNCLPVLLGLSKTSDGDFSCEGVAKSILSVQFSSYGGGWLFNTF